MSIRVLVVDDHPVLRTGLASLLATEDSIEIVGEAESGPECVEKASELLPDVVVMDINMPGGSGLDALDELRNLLPQVPVLVLTMHDDQAYLRRVLAAGGAGYVLKHAAGEELIAAIRTVADGGVFLHPQHARALALEEQADSSSDGVPADDLMSRYRTLSQREAEVFRLVSLGHTNAEIADMTTLSIKTVETYRSRLSQKLGLSGRASLVRAAIEIGVIS